MSENEMMINDKMANGMKITNEEIIKLFSLFPEKDFNLCCTKILLGVVLVLKQNGCEREKFLDLTGKLFDSAMFLPDEKARN